MGRAGSVAYWLLLAEGGAAVFRDVNSHSTVADAERRAEYVVDTHGHAVGCCETVPCDVTSHSVPQEKLQKLRLRVCKYLKMNIAHVIDHFTQCIVYH